MLPKWTGEVVGTAHLYGVSRKELAKECGMSIQALSKYLHGHMKSPAAESRIRNALMAVIERKEPEREDEEIE